jgi:hypothetical protein
MDGAETEVLVAYLDSLSARGRAEDEDDKEEEEEEEEEGDEVPPSPESPVRWCWSTWTCKKLCGDKQASILRTSSERWA